MKNWLKTLLSQTAFSIWWILSALSTLSTFFLHGWSGKPRIVFTISGMVGFAWANYRVFRIQERQIAALQETNQLSEVRVAQLSITPDGGSRYILCPASTVPHGDFNAMYMEFHLMIENAGKRNSTVNSFEVEVVELGQTFRNLTPEERRNSVQGRHCGHGLDTRSVLSETGVVRIPAESTTNQGTLLFRVSGVNLEMFVNRGLRMTGQERKFGPLHCRLTMTDTARSTTAGEFELHEE